MSVNKIDYEVLENSKTVYSNQATALDNIITTLNSTNSELANGWTNQTATAFLDRYENEYKVQLQNIRDAIQSISDYIGTYSANRQQEDADSAGAISG